MCFSQKKFKNQTVSLKHKFNLSSGLCSQETEYIQMLSKLAYLEISEKLSRKEKLECSPLGEPYPSSLSCKKFQVPLKRDTPEKPSPFDFFRTLLYSSRQSPISALFLKTSYSKKEMVRPEKGATRNLQKTSHILKANKNHTETSNGNIDLAIFVILRRSSDYNITSV